MAGRGPVDKASAEELIDKFDKNDGTDYGDQNDLEDDNDEQDAGDLASQADGDDDSNDDSGRSNVSDSNEESRTQGRSAQNSGDQQQSLRRLPNGTFQDQHGNLTDQNGRIIAKAGSERRLFEKTARMTENMQQKDQQIAQLQQQLSQVQMIGGLDKQYGLDQEDLRVGMPIIAEFKKDPVQAARNVLQMVMGMGHNLSTILGQEAKDAVEMGAIQRMLDQKLAPLQKIEQSAAQQQEAQRQQSYVEQQIREFTDSHEYATVHMDAIDNLLGRRPELTPERAYYEIRMFAMQHGLDFAKPLGPQIEALNAQNDDQQQNTRQIPVNRQTVRQQRPMPNGVSSQRNAPLAEVEEAEPSSDWGSIIGNALRSNGFRS